MPNFKVTVGHKLTKADAIVRIKSLMQLKLSESSDKIKNYTESWADNYCKIQFTTFGFDIRAKLSVSDSDVVVVVEYPWLGRVYKSQAELQIKQTLKNILINN